jgi:hypothetical protein
LPLRSSFSVSRFKLKNNFLWVNVVAMRIIRVFAMMWWKMKARIHQEA